MIVGNCGRSLDGDGDGIIGTISCRRDLVVVHTQHPSETAVTLVFSVYLIK